MHSGVMFILWRVMMTVYIILFPKEFWIFMWHVSIEFYLTSMQLYFADKEGRIKNCCDACKPTTGCHRSSWATHERVFQRFCNCTGVQMSKNQDRLYNKSSSCCTFQKCTGNADERESIHPHYRWLK